MGFAAEEGGAEIWGASHSGDTTGGKKWAAHGTQNTNILGGKRGSRGELGEVMSQKMRGELQTGGKTSEPWDFSVISRFGQSSLRSLVGMDLRDSWEVKKRDSEILPGRR